MSENKTFQSDITSWVKVFLSFFYLENIHLNFLNCILYRSKCKKHVENYEHLLDTCEVTQQPAGVRASLSAPSVTAGVLAAVETADCRFNHFYLSSTVCTNANVPMEHNKKK